MKGIIVYKTRAGSTGQYARWLREATGFELARIEEIGAVSLKDFDRVLIGCSIHKRTLALAPWIVENWAEISKKSPGLFITSGAPRVAKPFFEKVLEENLPEGIRMALPSFPVGGKYLFSEMKLYERMIIKLGASLARNSELRKGMLTETDDMRKENLGELLAWLKREGGME